MEDENEGFHLPFSRDLLNRHRMKWFKKKPQPESKPQYPAPAEAEVREITALELKQMLTSEIPPLVVDVREPYELAEGVIPGAVHIPMNSVPSRLDELPRDRDLVIHCAVGQRSWYVAQYLMRRGYEQVSSLEGGIVAWQNSN